MCNDHVLPNQLKPKTFTDDCRMENGNTVNCYKMIQGKCGNMGKMEEKRARDQEKKQKSVGESLTSK